MRRKILIVIAVVIAFLCAFWLVQAAKERQPAPQAAPATKP
jgi:hypothetical protein